MRQVLFAALVMILPALASAQVPALPDEAYIVAARFPSNPTTVVVDVLEVGGSQIGNNLTATQQTLDSVDSDVWTIDLNTVTGFATNCDQKTYIVRFVPDSADCQDSIAPDQCVDIIERSGGALCNSNPRVQVDYVFATGLVSAQGITQTVRDFYNRRQVTEPILWRRIMVANDLDFTAPDTTKWEVYFYSETGGVHIRCTVETESDPAISLPSAASCQS